MTAETLETVLAAALETVRHYLGRTRALVEIATEADLALRPAPDMRPVGDQLAIAIGFAGRAVLPFTDRTGPDWPAEITREGLLAYADAMAAALDGLGAGDLVLREIAHRAGFADVTQGGADYLLRFALPNMIFHVTAAHTGLKAAGHDLGKADFDAIHAYPAGFSFDA